jgi:electron transport complex protein RnfE
MKRKTFEPRLSALIKNMNYIKILNNGIVKENPTFVLLLGMCPTLATTTSALNGLSMGVATMAVLVCTNFVISCIKNLTPDKVRIPVFVVVIAAFVTILQLVVKAYLPDIDKSLGIFIPLIVVNCIILGRAEAFACKNTPLASIFDGLGIGLGFTLALTLLGMVRELIGAGSLFGATILPETCNVLLFVLPPGAFISLGLLNALIGHLGQKE